MAYYINMYPATQSYKCHDIGLAFIYRLQGANPSIWLAYELRQLFNAVAHIFRSGSLMKNRKVIRELERQIDFTFKLENPLKQITLN